MNTLIGFLEAAGVELPTTKAGEVMKKELTRAIRAVFPGASSRKRRRPSSTTRTRRENRPRSHPEDLPAPSLPQNGSPEPRNRQHN